MAVESAMTPSQDDGTLSLISVRSEGHREQYVEMFGELAERAGMVWRVSARWPTAMSDPAPVLFLMIEDGLMGYAVSAAWRSLTGRRTAGLLFQGGEAVAGTTWRRWLKGWALAGLRHLPGVSTFSITPFAVAPELSRVATGWIHDPQLWDFADGVPEASSALADEAVRRAGGRRIVAALGDQWLIKGFPYFCDLWTTQPALRDSFFFVSAGKVEAAAKDKAADFVSAGGMLADRFVTNEELFSLYGVSDLVWGCYAPDYDQASGIIGRAVQWGRPVAAREGSQMSRFLVQEGLPVFPLPWNALEPAAKRLTQPAQGAEPAPGMVVAFRSRSLDMLGQALGLERWRA